MSFKTSKRPGLLGSAVKQDYYKRVISEIDMEIMAHETKMRKTLDTQPDNYVLEYIIPYTAD